MLASFLLWFHPWRISLLVSSRVSVCSYDIQVSSSTLISSAQTRIWCVPFNSNPYRFFSMFLMIYFWAEVKTNSDKASSCFKSFMSVNASGKRVSLWISLQISLKRLYIDVSSLMGSILLITYITQLIILQIEISKSNILSFRYSYFVCMTFSLHNVYPRHRVVNDCETESVIIRHLPWHQTSSNRKRTTAE